MLEDENLLCLLSNDEPLSFKEAVKDEKWIQAMEKEIQTHANNAIKSALHAQIRVNVQHAKKDYCSIVEIVYRNVHQISIPMEKNALVAKPHAKLAKMDSLVLHVQQD